MRRPRRPRSSRTWAVVGFATRSGVALALLSAPALARARRPAVLVPANLRYKVDALGFRWDISQDGSLHDAAHNAFNQACRLQVNGSTFNSRSQPMMTPDGAEFVLSNRMGTLEVTRRIRIDTKLGIARHVDIFRNAGQAPAPLSIMLRTYLGTNCQQVLTDQGTASPTILGKKGSGLVAVQRSGQRPSILFFLASPRSKLKPSISIQNNYEFRFSYSTTVPPAQTVAIVHAMAQRRLGGTPDAKALATLFKPFRGRKWLSDLVPEVRKAMANVSGFRYDGAAPEVYSLKRLGITPESHDVVAFEEQTRLQGKAVCTELTVETRYGRKRVPFAQVAAVTGGKWGGRRGQVFLRDGRVLSGTIAASGLRFTMNSGLTIDLHPETLDRLVLHAKPDDGKPAEKVIAFVETFEGDRLAIVRHGAPAPAVRFTLSTSWGQVEAAADEIRWARLPEDSHPGHLVTLKDGSRFFGFLGGPPVQINSVTFGPQDVRPTDIRTIVAVGAEPPDEDEEPEILQPHVVLFGGSILVGRIDVPRIHLLASGEVIPLAPSQIRTLHNLSDEEGEPADGAPVFQAELWGGGTAAGRLREVLLPIRVGDRVCRVPTRDILDVAVPTPTVPDAVREKIARLIRDLGHPDWEAREAASQGLAELGHMAKAQLAEAAKQSTDPEVRRRAALLLEGMEK